MAQKKKDPYLEDAQSATLVRYGPELSALTALLRAAEQSYSDRVRQAKSAREFSVGSVNAAVPQVQQAYRGAQQAVAPAFAAQGGTEAQALTARIGEAQALAESQLAARRTSAVEGYGAAREQASREFRQDRQKIGDRSVDLAREMGAFTTQAVGEMRGADAAAQAHLNELNARLAQDERESVRSSGVDPDTGLPIPGGKLDPKTRSGSGKKWLTPQEQAASKDKIDLALKWANALKGERVARADAAASLGVGAEEIRADVIDPNTGKPAVWKKGDVVPDTDGKKVEEVNPDLINTKKTRVVQAKLPKIESQLLLTAALDMAYDGHLSRRTQKLLQARGIKIGPLGLTSFGEWLKTPEGQEWRRRQRSSGRLTRPNRPAPPRNAPSGYTQDRPT